MVVTAQSVSTGSRARASSTTASASASASIVNGPVATAATRTSSTRAHAMSRGVSPITTVRSRGQGGSEARPRAIAGSRPRSSWSEPKPPCPASKKRPTPARASFSRATGSRFPVTSESRNSSGRDDSSSSSSTIPGATFADRSAGQSRA